MKQSEVQIGKVYQVKVSGVLKPVRVDSQYPTLNEGERHFKTKFGGTVLTTGRKITLTARRMRKELPNFTNAIDPDYAAKIMYQDGKSAAANDKEEK